MADGRFWRGAPNTGPGSGWSAVAIILVVFAGRPCAADGGGGSIELREAVRRGSSTRVGIELKAHGLFRPGLPQGEARSEARMPKPLELEVQTRLVFLERVVQVSADAGAAATARPDQARSAAASIPTGRPLKAVRHVIQAASAINGEIRPTAASIRPEVAILFAERRARNLKEPVTVVSVAGPLTRAELELVEAVGDPLALADLLPDHPVALGEPWHIGDLAARNLTGYDLLVSNSLEGTLESSDDSRSRVRLKGTVEGSALGGPGTMKCDGYMTFDRKAARVDRLELNRDESRRPGPIEAGLDVKSTLSVTRSAADPPATLSNKAIAAMPLEITPKDELLRLSAPGGKATLLHDRQWHSVWDDPKLTVLKRLEGSQVAAQCNIAVGPPAGKGRHQDHNQFREDVRRALKQRFGQFLGAGLVDGDPAGGFRYKVGVQGHEGGLGVVWYYYLLAGPDGDQLLATFTLAEADVKAFGDQDMDMIASLRWSRGPAPAVDQPKKR